MNTVEKSNKRVAKETTMNIFVPDNFCKKTDKFSLYSFTNSRIGILTSKVFNGSFKMNEEYQITLLNDNSIVLNDEEVDLINKYQVVFFNSFNTLVSSDLTQDKKFYYFAVPLIINHVKFNDEDIVNDKETGIDFTTIRRLVDFEFKEFGWQKANNNLYWNKQLKKFFVFYNKNNLNNGELVAQDDDKNLNFFKLGDLVNKVANDMYSFNLIEANSKATITDYTNSVVLKRSDLVLTKVKSSIVEDMAEFKSNFGFLLMTSISQAFEDKYSLGIDFNTQTQSLISVYCSEFYNNDRFAYIGNNIVKFTTTMYDTLKFIKARKDDGKENLFKHIVNTTVKYKAKSNNSRVISEIMQNIGFDKFISPHYSHIAFQTPNIDFESIPVPFTDSCGRDSDFKSNSFSNFMEVLNSMSFSEKYMSKYHANVFEALTFGFYELGLKNVLDFFYSIKFLTPPNAKYPSCGDSGKIEMPKPQIPSITSIYPFENYFPTVKFNNLLDDDSIKNIQEMLGYTYKNLAFAERAFINESASNGLYDDDVFQVQELIGDAVLDILVAEKLNLDKSLNLSRLIDLKAWYVSNDSFENLVNKTGLIKYSQNLNKNIPDKHWGDLFESIIGSIFVDLEFDLDAMRKVFDDKIYGYLTKYYIVTDEDYFR